MIDGDMEIKYMEGADAISGSLATCHMTTFDEKRYNFMQLIKFESKVEKTVTEIPILGITGKAHKSSSWKGTWSGTAHYNQSVIRAMLLEYKKTGVEKPFTIQVINADPTSSVGKQSVILKGCLTSGGILSKFDVGSEYLDEEISGTFDDFEIPQKFSLLKGMNEEK